MSVSKPLIVLVPLIDNLCLCLIRQGPLCPLGPGMGGPGPSPPMGPYNPSPYNPGPPGAPGPPWVLTMTQKYLHLLLNASIFVICSVATRGHCIDTIDRAVVIMRMLCCWVMLIVITAYLWLWHKAEPASDTRSQSKGRISVKDWCFSRC